MLPGSFTQVLVKFISQDQGQEYAPLTDLIDALQISFPSEILASLEDKYTLFLYSQKETSPYPFIAGLGKNRLGLIISISQKEKINQQFADWEKTMPDDLDAIFLGKKISFTSNNQFQQITYRDAIIHSLDLPNKLSSLNYAFYNDKVLIATSLEAVEAAIDRMAPSQQ